MIALREIDLADPVAILDRPAARPVRGQLAAFPVDVPDDAASLFTVSDRPEQLALFAPEVQR